MELQAKVSYPARRVVDRLASPFGTNEVHLCERADGMASVLKIYRSGKAALTELRAIRLGQLQGPNPSIPRVLWAGRTAEGRRAIEYTFFPGMRYWDPQADTDARSIAALAAALRRLHLHPLPPWVTGWGPLGTTRERRDSWWRFLSERLDERGPRLEKAGRIAAGRIAELQSQLDRVAAASPQISPRLVHGDLNASNILVDANKKVVLIDFERALIGHSIYDFAKLWLQALNKDTSVIEQFLHASAGDKEFNMQAFALYRQLYAVDMAVYLLDHQNSDVDRQLLAELASLISNDSSSVRR
jgi:Ser/Thr protein kinase RdoA (MazF antagonist)